MFCYEDEGFLSIVRGTTNTFGIKLTDENGREHTLETGQVLVFGLKQNELDEERVLIKKITHVTNGEYYLELSANDTNDLAPGKYYYDLGMQHGSSVFYNIVKSSPFIILPNVTRLGDGL